MEKIAIPASVTFFANAIKVVTIVAFFVIVTSSVGAIYVLGHGESTFETVDSIK